MIKIKPFVIAQSNRLQNVAQNLSSNVINAIKNLNARQIGSIFNTFVPLDFIALISLLNKKTFDEAINNLIQRAVVSLLKDRKDIEKQDLAQSTFVNLLGSKDRPGILTNTLNQGSISREFNYTWVGKGRQTSQERREIVDLIRNSIKPNRQGMLVPYCPYDLRFDKKHLLWDIEVSGNQIEIIPGYDSEHRCTSIDIIDGPDNLTLEQKAAISSGLKSLEKKGDQWILRCTFKERLSTFSSFLNARVQQAAHEAVRQIASEKSEKKFERKEYQELYILENKIKQNISLDPEEQKRYKTLIKKLEKVEQSKTHTVSLDKPIGEEGRALHETITSVSEDELADPETVRSATTELLSVVDEEFLQLARSLPLRPLIGLMKQIADTPLKDPSRISKQQQLTQSIKNTVLNYLDKDQSEIKICINCKSEIPNDRCSYAEKMQDHLYTIYLNSNNSSEVESNVKKLDTRIQAHFKDAGLQSKFANFFNEQDSELLSTLGLNFESPSKEKLSEEQFLKQIEQDLTEAQRMSYVGSNIEQTLRVEENALGQAQILINTIKQGLDIVFSNELETELLIYIEAFGA